MKKQALYYHVYHFAFHNIIIQNDLNINLSDISFSERDHTIKKKVDEGYRNDTDTNHIVIVSVSGKKYEVSIKENRRQVLELIYIKGL